PRPGRREDPRRTRLAAPAAEGQGSVTARLRRAPMALAVLVALAGLVLPRRLGRLRAAHGAERNRVGSDVPGLRHAAGAGRIAAGDAREGVRRKTGQAGPEQGGIQERA